MNHAKWRLHRGPHMIKEDQLICIFDGNLTQIFVHRNEHKILRKRFVDSSSKQIVWDVAYTGIEDHPQLRSDVTGQCTNE